MILNRLKFALAAVLTGSSTTLATEPDIYDYVIIGSGPGGGSLA
jgi:choline dehydrogenase